MAEGAVKLSMRGRRVAACGVAAGICCASGAASPGSSVQLKPKTIAVVPGLVRAFAQDWPRLAWIRLGPPCGARVVVHDVRARQSIPLEQRDAPTCRRNPEVIPEPVAIAVGGSRAVWVVEMGTGAHSQSPAAIVTAAPGDRRNRSVGRHDGGGEVHGAPPALVAGSSAALVFYSGCRGCSRGHDVRGIVGRTSRLLFPVDVPDELARSEVRSPPALRPRALGLAAAGSRVAVLVDVNARCPCSVGPQWSPDGARIAWSERGSIYVMNADGRGKRRLSPAGGAALTAQPWSPDGTQLTYGHRRGDRAPWEVHVVRADGRGRRRLTAGEQPTWSPAGQGLSFLRNGDVWAIDADGRGARRLTRDGRGGEAGAQWSRDGTRLAALRRDGLYVIAADGSSQRRVGRPRGSRRGSPRWSPTDDRIAFTSQDRVFVVNHDGSGRRQLAKGRNPAWSPDGRRLAFQGDVPPRVFVVSSAGGRARPVTRRAILSGPSWSPDGDAIVAGDAQAGWYDPRGRGAGIYRVAPDGSALKNLTPAHQSGVEVRDARTGARLASFTVSGDAHALALSRSYLALLVGANTLRVHRPRTGALVASTRVPKNAERVAVSDSGIVAFHVGGQIRAFDVRTRAARTIVTAVAGSRKLAPFGLSGPLGLSIDGRRLAWVENRRNRAVIRAVTLPTRLR
jgi:Tol biopolymer transport system component